VALVGISSVTSLIIGLVLYSFAQNQLMDAENTLLRQRSQTANAGAQEFLESLRDPEDQTLPPAEDYAEELVTTVGDPTGLEVIYVGPDGEPLAARDGLGDPEDPDRALGGLGLEDGVLEKLAHSSEDGGKQVWSEGRSGHVAVWPLVGRDGTGKGALVYDVPKELDFGETLSYLRFGIVGAILTSVLLAAGASLLLARQLTRPLSETRDAAIRVASGDYAAVVPVKGRDELGELARAFNYMAEEIEHYVGEIQEQKSRLEAVLEASPEAVVATDGAERVTMVNPAAARMLGVRHSDRGRALDDLGIQEGIVRCVREAAANGVAVREVDLGEKTFWAYAARMDRGQDGGGKDAGIILAVRDITEHRSLEKAKMAFVSDFSHELRTPLTTIQSAVGLLERARERLDPLEHRALELAEGELARIRAMVEELLTLAQMDSWQYQLEVGPANLGDVIRTAMRSVETKAQRFGIEVYFEDEVEHRCVCDRQKIYQVFLNLLDNAIKYSDPGDRVDVSVEEDVSWLTVRVRDTGIGIPKEDLEQLFERFYRVNKDRSRATGGSGLGLAISKQILEMHGGDISVESEVGRGSTFLIHLPKAPLSRSSSYAL
jgi:PAS domain S-box-containing protein